MNMVVLKPNLKQLDYEKRKVLNGLTTKQVELMMKKRMDKLLEDFPKNWDEENPKFQEFVQLKDFFDENGIPFVLGVRSGIMESFMGKIFELSEEKREKEINLISIILYMNSKKFLNHVLNIKKYLNTLYFNQYVNKEVLIHTHDGKIFLGEYHVENVELVENFNKLIQEETTKCFQLLKEIEKYLIQENMEEVVENLENVNLKWEPYLEAYEFFKKAKEDFESLFDDGFKEIRRFSREFNIKYFNYKAKGLEVPQEFTKEEQERIENDGDDERKYDMNTFQIIPSKHHIEFEEEEKNKHPYENTTTKHHFYLDGEQFHDFTTCFLCGVNGDYEKNQCVKHMKCEDDDFVEQDGFDWKDWCENHCECECEHCEENKIRWEEWEKQGKKQTFECKKKKEKSKKKKKQKSKK